MSAGAIILCRLDSRRLPGKALHQVGGRPLIDFALQRCRAVAALEGNIVLATSTRDVDDPLADFARENGLWLFRGPTDDVAGRVLACARQFGFRYFVRVNGDSPFLDPSLVDQAVRLAEAGGLDLVTNLVPRSFPYGVSVEVVRTEAFADAFPQMTRPDHREHVTKYLYEQIGLFRYANITCPAGDWSRVRLTVDTPEDLDWFGRMVARFGDDMDRLSYAEALRFLSEGVRAA